MKNIISIVLLLITNNIFCQNLNCFFEMDSTIKIQFSDAPSSKDIFNSTKGMFLFFKKIPDYNIEANETKNECTKIMNAFFNEDLEYLDSNRFLNNKYFWLDSNENNFSNYMKYFPEFKIKFCQEYYDTIKNKWSYRLPAYSLSDLPIFDTLVACNQSYNLIYGTSRNIASPEFLIQSINKNKNVVNNVYEIIKDEYDENGNELLSKYEISTIADNFNDEKSFVVTDENENQLLFGLNMNELNTLIYATGQMCLSTSWSYKYYPFDNDIPIKKYTFTFYKIIGDNFWGNNDEWMNDKKLCENDKIKSNKINIRKWNLASISVETQKY